MKLVRGLLGWGRVMGGALGVMGCSGLVIYSDGSDPEVLSPGRPPKVGEPLNGGEVTSVQPMTSAGDCYRVTIEQEPEWACSSDQLAELRGLPSTTAPAQGSLPQRPASSEKLAESDCSALAELRRPALKQAQRNTLSNQRGSLLRAKCIGRKETRLYDARGEVVSSCPPPRQQTPPGGYAGAPYAVLPSAPNDSALPSAPGSGVTPGVGDPLSPNDAASSPPREGASEYSTTNTQVYNVDEADFVKNDAEHVYVLSPAGLHVIDAWPAEDTREVARVRIDGVPRRMFLDGDRLVVYASQPVSSSNPYGGAAIGGGTPSAQGCTYGYDCRFTSEGGSTLVQVFDVSNPAEPTLLQKYQFSGGFVAARRVGPYVYSVVHDAANASSSAAPGVALKLEAHSAEELDLEYTRLTADADSAVDALPDEFFLPWLVSQTPSGERESVTACDAALAGASARGASFVSLVAFDLTGEEPLGRTLVATKPGFVYASASALYLAVDGVEGADSGFFTGTGTNEQSTIHRFALKDTRTSYSGSAAIRGHVLNQFSMDEHGGVLRVATSSGRVPSPDVSSNVTTLVEADGQLQRLGELTGLAPQEDIRSVRFDGDRGYIVTFKKTDPLFVIDLERPEQPQVLGELKIPGFSTYMHRLDANHLLAVGFDADDRGSFAYFDGIQIQIFDVSEPTAPELLHKTVVGTRGSGSEALMNHLAFNYFPQKGLLALPMTICEGGGDGVYGGELTFSGLMVFDVSLSDGVRERGRLPFVTPPSAPAGGASSCASWWTSNTSLVKRSIFLDDFAYGISDTALKVGALSNLSTVLGSVSLGR